MPNYSDYADIIAELDACDRLPPESADFIIDLVEDEPKYLSEKQVAWIKNLQQRYLA
jgi:hypothetical protein